MTATGFEPYVYADDIPIPPAVDSVPGDPRAYIPWRAVSTAQAAELLGVSEWTIKQAVNVEKTLRAKKIRNSTRIDVHELYAWFHSQADSSS